ncbi:MAG: RDD family protein, partial [Actinobacteria bacterium]|nr:RDD family protein [Actinomycetota bacterium]
MDGIVTPEAVVLDVETAGVASRVFAGLIDFAIQMGVLVVGLMLLAIVGSATVSSFNMGAALLVAFVIMGYPVLSETLMRGRTVGKRALGLRAVTLEGAPIRLRHALLRMMGGLVDRYLLPLGVTGMLFVVGTARHQRVGDLISGTIVIRDPDRTLLPPAVWFPVPPGLEGFAATIDPTAMTDEQYTVIRSFLMRNRELSADARFSLA